MDLLTVEALERDLQNAESELAKASAERLKSQEIESQWQTEVNSLRNLIQVRRQRLNPDHATRLGGQLTLDALRRGEKKPISKVHWMGELIKASGEKGISPPEILQAAEEQHIKMHPNYPYVVLKKLQALDLFVKQGGRYYAVENLI